MDGRVRSEWWVWRGAGDEEHLQQDPFKLLKEGKKLLKAMQGYRKKVQKAEKKGQDKPPVPARLCCRRRICRCRRAIRGK